MVFNLNDKNGVIRKKEKKKRYSQGEDKEKEERESKTRKKRALGNRKCPFGAKVIWTS